MEDMTTTEAPVEAGEIQNINGVAIDDQGMAISQPDETEPAAAETTTVESEEKTEATSEPSEDEQLAKFAATKGLELDSDNAKKAAKMAMNAEKLMHNKANKVSELERVAKITEEQIPADFTPQQVDTVRMRNLELKFDIQQWKTNNPDKLELESEMVKIVSDPTKRQLVQEGYLSLDDVYSMARGSNVDAVKSQGKREALESLAHKQQAAVPTGNAVNSSMTTNTITSQNVDKMVATHDLNWFIKNQDAINRAMAGN